ncbi:MAG: hypothetical protein OHK0015_06650 [Chloroflexi bacterium OHK40]
MLVPLVLRRKGTVMARRRIPPELRRRTWAEGTVWELLVAADILLYRFASPFADLGMTVGERRKLRREVELLKATRVAYILPHNGGARRPLQPWLYVQTRRGGYFRVGDAGEIQRFGRRTQRLGSGSITEHGWYHCFLRGVRWLQVVAAGRMVQKAQAVRDDLPADDRQLPTPGCPGEAASASVKPVQLLLFSEVEQPEKNRM